MFISSVWREPCLKILKYALVFFLCQKTGRFLSFFHNYFSRFHKIKCRTYIKNLRHGSLEMNVLCTYGKFHALVGEPLGQNVNIKKITGSGGHKRFEG